MRVNTTARYRMRAALVTVGATALLVAGCGTDNTATGGDSTSGGEGEQVMAAWLARVLGLGPKTAR